MGVTRLDRQPAQTALFENEAFWQAISDAAPVPLFITRVSDSKIIYANARVGPVLGLRPDDVVGRKALDFYHDPAYRNTILNELAAQGAIRDHELRMTTLGGDTVWVSFNAELQTVCGEPALVCGFVDITERKRSEQALRESEERFRVIVETAPIPVFIARAGDGTVLYANSLVGPAVGYTADGILGLKTRDFYRQPERREELMEILHRDGRIRDFEIEVVHANGTSRWISLNCGLLIFQGESAIVTGFVDVTERKSMEQALRESEQRFRVLYDHNPSMFFTLDPLGTILSVNEFGARQLGYHPDELKGQPASMLFAQEEQIAVRGHIEQCLRAPDDVHRWELRKRRKNGSCLWVRETARVLPGETGATVLIVCEDVTEAHILSEQLSYQASHDVLTGLANRRAFENQLQTLLKTAHEEGAEHALCYLDLDWFKTINDTCGHAAGDELLRQLSSMLQTVVRRGDMLARLGGDEFAVLMRHCTLRQARRVADAVRAAIHDYRFVWEGRRFNIGSSIGLVPIDRSGRTISDVLDAADAACYAAKAAGRNRVHVQGAGEAEPARRLDEMRWVERIEQALTEDRLKLVYQPIRPADGSTVTPGEFYKLLLRLEDEHGRLATPDVFSQATEHYYLWPRLDRWMVATACRWLAVHPQRLANTFLCSINLSGQSLADDDFPVFTRDLLEETGIPPDRLCFDIGENAVITNLSGASRQIMALRKVGCRIALDGFGNAWSSFACLRSLPVDFIRISGTLVKNISGDPVDLAMVKSIHEISRAMNKKTIAVFVETDATLTRLQEIGIDYVQGYAIGRPKSLDMMFCIDTISPAEAAS